jgi:hypothetical protein
MRGNLATTRLFALAAYACAGFQLLAAPDEKPGPPLRVLFIGNSYTHYNNLPEMVAALSGGRIETRMVARGGWTLQQHWDSPEALAAIREGKWDYVVLQEHSLLGGMRIDSAEHVNDPDFFFSNVRRFDAEIRNVKAKTVLYMTWARRVAPEQQAHLTWAYLSIAQELGALVAPAGMAWQTIRETDPSFVLHSNDGSHPSPSGSYLTACVMVHTLLGAKAPETLPARIQGHPVPTNTERVDLTRVIDLISLAPERAEILQKAALEAVNSLTFPVAPTRPASTSRAPLPAPKRPFTAADVAGTWRGNLRFYAIPVQMELRLNAEGNQCAGQITIWTPNDDRRLRSPVSSCRVTEVGVAFVLPDYRGSGISESYWSHYTGETLTGWADFRGIAKSTRLMGSFELRRQK